ncbi:MAG: hypothetical protein ACYDHE_11140, partial [Candidatus Acidiferrales bacterium]
GLRQLQPPIQQPFQQSFQQRPYFCAHEWPGSPTLGRFGRLSKQSRVALKRSRQSSGLSGRQSLLSAAATDRAFLQSELFAVLSFVLAAQPILFRAEPQLLAAQPIIFCAEPQLLAAQPFLFRAEPQLLAAQPFLFRTEPQLLAA